MHHFILKYPLPFGRQKTIERHAPECWNELSGQQLVKVLALIAGSGDVYLFRLRIIKLLLGLNWFQMWCYNTVELIQVSQHFRWIEEKVDRTKAPFRRLKGLAAPPDYLVGLTAIEFYLMDQFYRGFINGDESGLDQLIACLYRPRKMKWIQPGQDLRQAFDPNNIALRTKKISCLSQFKKLAVLRFYESCRQSWENRHPNVFSNKEGDSSSFGWPEVFIKVAETGVFGSEPQVQQTPISNIFLKMEIDIKDYEKYRLKNPTT